MHVSVYKNAYVYKYCLLVSLYHLHKRFIPIFIQIILGEFIILSATPTASQTVDKCRLFRCCGETGEALLLNLWLLMCTFCGFGCGSDRYCP